MAENCNISDLLVNPYNRDIKREKVDSIKQAIKESGEIRPLVYAEVDHDGKPGKMITDGHHRYHALKEMGYKEVPVIMQDERGIKTKAPMKEVEKSKKSMTNEEILKFIKETANTYLGDTKLRGHKRTVTGSVTVTPGGIVDKDAASGAVKPREKGKTFLNKAELLDAIKGLANSYLNKSESVQKSVTRPAQNVRVKQPDPTSPQANTGQDQDKINSINDELTAMLSGLQQMEAIAHQQGLLTDDEVNNIIIPLRDNITGLLTAMQPTDDFHEEKEVTDNGSEDFNEGGDSYGSEENTWTPTDASNPAEVQDSEEATAAPDGNVPSETDPEEQPSQSSRSKKKPEPGPKRQVGTAERSLEYPADANSDKSIKSGDVEKALPWSSGEGKGFRGDPQRHADAARARWEQEGVPPGGKPKEKNPRQPASGVEDKKPIPDLIRRTAQKTVNQAASNFARGLGNTVGELGWRAAATVFTIIAYRYLSGESTQVRDLARLGMGGVKAALQRSFQLRRIDNLSRVNKMARLVRAWAEKK